MECTAIISYNNDCGACLARVRVTGECVLTNELLAKRAARYLPRKIRDFYRYAHVERMGK
jgi:hypothetical protein